MRLLSNVSSFSSPCSCPLSELGEREREPSSSSRYRPSGSYSPVANFLCGSWNVQDSCSSLHITERSGKHTFLLRSQISGNSIFRFAGDSFSYSSYQSRPSSPFSNCLRTSQLYKVSPGNGRVLDIAATERLRQLGISRVGSALRNLEKEDDTEEDRSDTQIRKSHQKYDETEESAVHEEHGNDGLSALTPPIVSVTVTGPRLSSVLTDDSTEKCEQHQGIRGSVKNYSRDEYFAALALPDVSAAGPSTSLQSWNLQEDLKEEREGGWREAVIEGLGPPNGAVQLRGRIFEEDEEQDEDEVKYGVSPEEERRYQEKASLQEDYEEDESANITRIPVPRQTYIAVSKVELVSTLLTSFPSAKEASALLEIFSCLESVLHAEHKSVLEELRMDYRLAHSIVEEEKPSTSKAASDQIDEDGTQAQNWRPRNWWQKFAQKIKGSRKDLKKVTDDILLKGASRDENGRLVEEDSTEETVVETQGEKAAERFQRHFMRLLRRAQFEGLSVSDLKLTAALNSDYLLTLPIDVDWNSAASADALLFRRGYATERQKGLLFGAKLDYLQSVMLSKMFNGLTGPLFRAGRWCIEKWESLEEDEDGRALTERFERWLEEPLQRAAQQPSKTSRVLSDDESSESDDDEEGLEIWKAARQAVPRYEAVLSSAGSRGLLIRRLLVRMGLLPPESPGAALRPSVDQPAPEPYMRPKMLTRVSMRDIWKPASKAACGNNPWKRIRAAFSIFFSRSTLQEPAFQELVLLYNSTGNEKDENGLPQLQLHTYTRIPLPDLKVVFPSKKLSFRLIDTVRLDLATFAGLGAFLVSHKFDDLLSSPSAFALDLIASVSLIVYISRVALGYKQTANRYQLLVNKTLYEKTLASGFGVVQFLLDASEEQQFKEAILVYSLLLLEARGQSMSVRRIANLCERYLYNNFKEQVEMPMQEVVASLLRLGLVVEDKSKAEASISIVPDGRALAALKERWLALMSKQSIWSVR